MHLQIVSFDGPRSPEQVAASERAGRERIMPLIDADPQLRSRLLAGYHCVGEDGAEVTVVVAQDEAFFDAMERLIMTSELLPGEDPALLTTPSRVQRFAVHDVFGSSAPATAPAGVRP
ncbi:MAG: hypothetical protein ACOYBY_01295 [Dermatophilaceae bacterium]